MTTASRIRPESFGAIVSLEEPPLLAWVDRAMARTLGVPEQASWVGAEDHNAALSGPTEVHILLTGRCPAKCSYCYASSSPDAEPGPDQASARRMLESLARLKVFHVALGGGESTLRDDLFELAAYARSLGIVPNLTSSGLGMTQALAERCRVFGQVNVSIDGLGELHVESRGDTSFKAADRALRSLLKAGVRAGINTVLSRQTFDALESLVAYAAEVGASEVELLRLKPTGRAREVYADRRMTDAQHLALLPKVLELARKYRIHLKLDCSFSPMICAHAPPLEVLEAFSVVGCDAGNSLGAILPDGSISGCSFVEASGRDGERLDALWTSHPVLDAFRQYPLDPPEPCRSCPYRRVCKGGCKAVSTFVTGQFAAPDPECPRVILWESRKGHAEKEAGGSGLPSPGTLDTPRP